MGQSAQKQDMLSVPSGGIADFYMSDEDIAVIEQEEVQKAFGSEGVAAFDEVAKRMASYGRFGDDRIVHVESGEIVVPRALIEQSPELKESIFSHLREQGVEDPERYVVGSSANSLNPETGLPEFFLSKILRGVKKSVKSVGKVLKKAAPIVLPIALAATPLGAVYGAALGSGIATLMQGGSPKDAVKNAVIAGGTGALFKGFTGDAGSFGKNVSAEFADPAGRFGQTFSLGGGGYEPVTAPPVSSEPAQAINSLDRPQDFAMTPKTGGASTQTGSGVSALESIKETIMPSDPTAAQIAQKSQELMSINPNLASADAIALAQKELTPGFLRKYGPSIALAGLGAGALGAFDAPEVEEVEYDTGAELIAQRPGVYDSPPERLRYITDYDPFVPPPTRIRQPIDVIQAAEGGVIGGLRGLAEYSEDVVGNLNDIMYGGQGPSGNVFNRPTLGVGFGNIPIPGGETGIQPRPMMSPVTILKGLGSLSSNILPDALYAAEGGEIFPRRTGGIMPDEGVPNEDSVRAMLMPGEFVMTTDAVKGLGNGDNEQGIRKMYDMMRGLEAKGRAMA